MQRYIICLWATPRNCRTTGEQQRKTSAKGANLNQIAEILERRVKYLSADHVIKTDGLPTNQVAEQVIELLDSSMD